MMDVTFSKQWIHFLRSLRWPPTSNMLGTVSRRHTTLTRLSRILYTQLSHCEPGLIDTCSLGSSPEHVCLCRGIFGSAYPVRFIEEAMHAHQYGHRSAKQKKLAY